MQSAAYRIILDKEVGNHKLHPKAFMVAAGNLSTDRAVVSRMSTALQSRMCHLELQVSHGDWLTWAVNNDIDHRVISYIRFSPDSLYKFDPNHNDKTFAAPRTWEFLSKIIKNKELDNLLPLLVGCIGPMGIQFKGYCEVYAEIPSKEDIINDPENAKLKKEGSYLYAISGFITSFVSEDNIEQIMKYCVRMPKEFQVISLRNVLEKNKLLLKAPSVKKWVISNASSLL